MKLITHKALILAAILANGSAIAAGTPPNPTGSLQFSGTVTNAACQLTINGSSSGNNLIFNETIPSSPVYTKGDIINNDTRDFDIVLSQCSGVTIDPTKITTSFQFTSVPNESTYIADTSTNNTGLGFQIIGASGQAASTGVAIGPVRTSNVQTTAITLEYKAQMIATNSTVTANKAATANVPFTVSFP